ncbi:phosphotransferase enzyme family protein [Kribbella sp. NPDC051620]|uniref:phosphotransferase enzyme family protein n=1 Tax=Kribbella sp. NPDC051620 TaxID=3364120 RepID=UPI00379BCCC0
MSELTSAAGELAEVFGVGQPVRMSQVARGAMGAVWRLETDTGVYAAKNLFWNQGDAASIRTEVAFRAACAEAGVRSPLPLPAVDGEYVVQLTSGRWRLYEWADGEVPDRQDAEAVAWLAGQMGIVHALDWSGGTTEVAPWYHRVEVEWPPLVAAAEAAQVEWAPTLEKLRPRLTELTALANESPIGDQVWCHRDLKNTNVLRSADRTYLVDWDNVGPLAPWRELGALLLHHLDQPRTMRRIIAAYREAGGPADLDGACTFATGVAIQLNFLHGQATATLDANLTEAHRSFARRQVSALLTSTPTLGQLEEAATAN